MGLRSDPKLASLPCLITPVILALCFPAIALGGDWYVDVNDPDCATGTGGPVDPFCCIQDAINIAFDGDTIHIAPGTYQENLRIDRDLLLVGTGGSDLTILDGNQLDRVALVTSSRVVQLQGLTLSNGVNATNGSGGAGLYVDTSATVTLQASVVCDNVSSTFGDPLGVSYGGGIFVADYATLIANETLVEGNVSVGTGIYAGGSHGGGVFSSSGSSVLLRDSIVSDNYSVSNPPPWSHGGAIAAFGSVTLINTTINGNSAGRGGGVFVSSADDVTLTNTIIADNTARHLEGGGLFVDAATRATLVSSTVAGNSSVTGGGGVSSTDATSTLYVQQTIVARNSALTGPDCAGVLTSWGHNLIQDPTGCTVAGDPTGNLLGVNPLFNPVGPGSPRYTLSRWSPCIDAGDPVAIPTGQDALGTPRLLDGNLDQMMCVDMGAYEFSHARLAVTGNPVPGGTLRVDLMGTQGLRAWLWLGSASGELFYPPFGSLFLDLSAAWWLFPIGPTPATQSGTIPPGTPSGTFLVLQGLSIETSSGAGNFSNLVQVTVL